MKAVNDNPHYANAGKDWTHGTVALIVKADPAIDLEQDMAILLDVNAGVCRGANYLTGTAARDKAAFAVEGPYDNWKKLIVENQDPIKALMQGKLKLTKGHLPTMIRYVESSKQLLSSAQAVATEFRR
jgi:putative sterol carrier protein